MLCSRPYGELTVLVGLRFFYPIFRGMDTRKIGCFDCLTLLGFVENRVKFIAKALQPDALKHRRGKSAHEADHGFRFFASRSTASAARTRSRFERLRRCSTAIFFSASTSCRDS